MAMVELCHLALHFHVNLAPHILADGKWWNFAISPFIFTAWGLVFMAVKYVWGKFRGSS